MTYQAVFPAALQPAASALLRLLPAVHPAPLRQGFSVLVHGEALSPPLRIYCSEGALDSAIAASTGDARTLALCFGTRHCYGQVREACVRQLLPMDRPWVVPFVVQMLGEYVVEIVQAIAVDLSETDPVRFANFVSENAPFMATTRRRATSYWACYYRNRFSSLRDFPSIVCLDTIERMAGSVEPSHGHAPG